MWLNDGDKALVVAEPTIISVAERECSDVVPLYYPMAKAGASEVTPEAMYNGMVAAWSGGNIGEISNSISKIWGSNNPDVDAVKVFCMENNFVIDYAKTLYKPTRPKEWEERLKEQTRGKVPSFFQYAKGKTESQVSARGNGVVDRLYNQVQMYKFDFNIKSHGALDYRMLMYNENIPYGEKERKLVQEFRKASASMGTSAGVHDENSRYWLQLKELKQKIMAYGSRQYVVDVLVRGLFYEHHVRKKSAFWDCFGDVVLENLKNNLPDKTKCCPKCGTMYPDQARKICPRCMDKKSLFGRVMRYFLQYKWRICLMFVCYLAIGALNLAWPYLSGAFLYDKVLSKDAELVKFTESFGGKYTVILAFTVAAMVVTKIIMQLLGMLHGAMTARIVPEVVA